MPWRIHSSFYAGIVNRKLLLLISAAVNGFMSFIGSYQKERFYSYSHR